MKLKEIPGEVRNFLLRYQPHYKNLAIFLLFLLGIGLALTGIGAIEGIPLAVGLLAGVASFLGMPLLPIAIAASIAGIAIAVMPRKAANLLFSAIDLAFDTAATAVGLLVLAIGEPIAFVKHVLGSKKVNRPKDYAAKYHENFLARAGDYNKNTETMVFNLDASNYPASVEQKEPNEISYGFPSETKAEYKPVHRKILNQEYAL